MTFGTGVYRKSVHCEIKKTSIPHKVGGGERNWTPNVTKTEPVCSIMPCLFYSDSRIIIVVYRIFVLVLR